MTFIQIGRCSNIPTPKALTEISQYLSVSQMPTTPPADTVVVAGVGVDLHALLKRYLLVGTLAFHELCGSFIALIYDRGNDVTFVCRDVLSAFSLFTSTLDTKQCEGVVISGQPLPFDSTFFPPGHIVQFLDGDISTVDVLRPVYPCATISMSALSAKTVLSDLLRSVLCEKLQSARAIAVLFDAHDVWSEILASVARDVVTNPVGDVLIVGLADWRPSLKTNDHHLRFDGRIHDSLFVFAPFLDTRVASFLSAVSDSLSSLTYSS